LGHVKTAMVAIWRLSRTQVNRTGTEKMRLLLCCLTLDSQSPDLIVLDERTNNLDLQNLEILTAAVNEYRGTLLVISPGAWFLEEIGIERTIQL
jgi:ATPase subunit of ABC transporter with duplicated ATPase domains